MAWRFCDAAARLHRFDEREGFERAGDVSGLLLVVFSVLEPAPRRRLLVFRSELRSIVPEPDEMEMTEMTKN